MIKEPCAPLSQTISQLFDSEQYSDLKVVFPKSNRTVHLHRNIICPSSEFFKACLSYDMKETSEGGVVTMSEDDDEESMTALFKACYHFEIEVPSDKTRIVPLIQSALKYQFDSMLPTLVQYLVKNIEVKTNVLQCLHLDLDNNVHLKPVKKRLQVELQHSAKKILEGDSYLTLGFHEWRNALQLMVHRENRAVAYDSIHSWIAVDVDNRCAYSFELLQIVKSAVTKEVVASFDAQACGSRATLLNNNLRIRKDGSNGTFNCGALGSKPCTGFSVRLIRNCGNLMIGVATKSNSSYKKDGNNYGTCGYYLYCFNGNLYSERGDYGKQYIDASCSSDGTVIGVKINEHGYLRFSVNGEDKGVAFWGLPLDELYAAFDLWDANCEFEFV